MTLKSDQVQMMNKHQEQVNALQQDDQYVDSDNIIILLNEKDLIKVADSEDSEKFVKSDDKEWLLTHKERWLKIYADVLNTLLTREQDYTE